jgi:hypothetical protein
MRKQHQQFAAGEGPREHDASDHDHDHDHDQGEGDETGKEEGDQAEELSGHHHPGHDAGDNACDDVDAPASDAH